VPPSRSAAIVHMIEDFLGREQPPDSVQAGTPKGRALS
jgi:hypothetical protein